MTDRKHKPLPRRNSHRRLIRLVEEPEFLTELPKRQRKPKQQLPPEPAPMDVRTDEIMAFSRQLVETKDLVPEYLILRELAWQRGYDEEQKLWLSLVYVGFHHLPSALATVRLVGDLLPEQGRVIEVRDQLNALPVTVERRLFHGRMAEYLIRLLEEIGEPFPKRLSAFFTRGLTMGVGRRDLDRRRNFRRFVVRWTKLPGHRKRWASFELARVMRYVHDWPIQAPGLMLEGDMLRYPTIALQRLYKSQFKSRQIANRLADMFYGDLQRNLVDLDWEMVEILLRKVDLYLRGRYYVGYSHDEILSHMNRLESLHNEDRADLLAARARCFDPAYLGELGGWDGVRVEKLRPGFRPRIVRPVWEH